MQISIIGVLGLCCAVLCNTAVAYGGMGNTASAMSAGRMNSGYAISLNLKLPYNIQLNSQSMLSTSSRYARSKNFDASQAPVHELPPLPLSLDVPEKDS